jgi:hypothetical protein
MWKDEVVEEVRRTREQQAARLNFDLKAILADVRKRQKDSGRRVVSLVPKPKEVG